MAKCAELIKLEMEVIRRGEAVIREKARNNLNDFCKYIEIPGAPINDTDDCDKFYPNTVTPAAHHELLNGVLQRVEAKEVTRVMVFMPPGSAKSTYASVTFPTWFMGKNPRKNIISTSYGSDLAKKFGRRCRQIVGSKKYSEVFNIGLVADNRAVDNWSLTNESTYMSGGILSGITGNRADGLIIDDPVKGREEAESKTMREKTWDAYLSDLRTRLKPKGWIVIIQTRWQADDLSGRILPMNYDGRSGTVESRDGEQWEVICLPAQASRDDDPLGRKPGEYLWTEWFPAEYWEAEKRIQGGRNWSALYQQTPRMEEGGVFMAAWFKYFKTPPADFIRIVQSWDTAQKENELNDFSVCTTWIQTRRGFYLIHLHKERMNYPKLKRAVVSLAARFKPNALLIEDKGSGISLIQDLAAETALPVIAIEPNGNKEFRAAGVSPLYEAGRVWHKEDEPWLIDYETELACFPAVEHDDSTDSTTQALEWMNNQADKFEIIVGKRKRTEYDN